MAHTKTPKPTAAENRKAADDALNARVKARQEAAAAKKDAPGTAAPAPVGPTKAPAPWEQAVATGAQQAAKVEEPKAKKERKPREAKPKVAPDAELADLVKQAQDKAVKAAVKEVEEHHKAILKGTVDKTFHDAEVKKAYEAGVAEGKRQSIAGIKAALKGGA